MYWVIGIILLLIIGFILDREIYFYEGVHLGPRFQAWFYDQWATKYDAGKKESQLHDDEMLAQPLMGKLEDLREPFILDFATGTGRLSYALINRPEFQGHIIALDISQKMLEQAVEKTSRAPDGSMPGSGFSVEFLRHPSLPLPFPEAAFDVVCCLEVLELLPDAQAALYEMARVLRPGGVLLTSRGTEESRRRAKVKSTEEFTSMLRTSGFENVQITTWWKLFDRVFASRRGTSDAVGTRRLSDVLNCSSCRQIRWEESADHLHCSNCGKRLTITQEGIVLN